MSSVFEGEMFAKLSLAVVVVITFTVVSQLWSNFRYSQAMSKFPMANEKWDAAAKKEFTESGASILAKGVTLVRTLHTGSDTKIKY
jgi:type II secretory pathway component PulF